MAVTLAERASEIRELRAFAAAMGDADLRDWQEDLFQVWAETTTYEDGEGCVYAKMRLNIVTDVYLARLNVCKKLNRLRYRILAGLD